MSEKANCCHDELSIIKVTDCHSQAEFSFAYKTLGYLLLDDYWFYTRFIENNPTEISYSIKSSPPLLKQVDSQALNCVFRI